MAGLKVMTDYADRLKEADDAWRKANLEKAKEYPDPTDDPWSAARRIRPLRPVTIGVGRPIEAGGADFSE